MMNVGIDLAGVVKIPKKPMVNKITHSVVEGIKIPMGDFLLKIL